MPPATPLERAPDSISRGSALWWKREDIHELGAFKWRGALPTLELYRVAGARGVVTASTGNHGAATAWAARRLGLAATVYVPRGASGVKLGVLAAQGAQIREAGADLDEAKEEARAAAVETGLPFFEDGAEAAQFDGYETVAKEILEQLSTPPGTVIVPVGNGALLAGVGAAFRRISPTTRRIGVAAKEAPVMALSFRAGHAVSSDRSATFADGLAVRVAIPRAVEALARAADEIRLVSERQMARAVGTFHRSGILAEGAAAAALAVFESSHELPSPVVVIVTGRNIDPGLHRRAVEEPESFPD